MARITYSYRQYPLSEKLTNKSKNVAFFTHPLFGLGLGTALWLGLSIALDLSSDASNVLMGIGMIGGPIALLIIRAKKFAQYDAEYAKILKEQEKKNTANKQPVVQQKPAYQQPVQQQPVQQQPVYQQPVQQQQVQQPVTYQTPVMQQSAYHPPVMQQPAQPTYQPPVYQMSKTLDEQIDEICKIANDNLNAQNDPKIYWECAQKLEQMLQAHPDHERLQRETAQILLNYSWHSTCTPFTERRKAYNAARRSLTLEKKKRETTELDHRKYCLIWHAVHGGREAGNLFDIGALEDALLWLRTAATYKMEVPDAERQQYQNVAIPSARFYVGYWLGKAYLEQSPPQKQKAKAVIEEALQACPYALIRQCDLNPNRNTDTATLITRENLMSLLQLASQ